jgi:hypothetical protein
MQNWFRDGNPLIREWQTAADSKANKLIFKTKVISKVLLPIFLGPRKNAGGGVEYSITSAPSISYKAVL